MARFSISLTDEAKADVSKLRRAIEETYQAPLTASRYVAELNTKMKWLENGADYFPIVPELSCQYGFEIRRLNFKKMAVLYSIEENIVIVHRIIPQNLII